MARQMSQAEKTERGRLAAQSRWKVPGARKKQSEIMSAALLRRHEQLVDPDGVLDPVERLACAKASISEAMSRAALARYAKAARAD